MDEESGFEELRETLAQLEKLDTRLNLQRMNGLYFLDTRSETLFRALTADFDMKPYASGGLVKARRDKLEVTLWPLESM